MKTLKKSIKKLFKNKKFIILLVYGIIFLFIFSIALSFSKDPNTNCYATTKGFICVAKLQSKGE